MNTNIDEQIGSIERYVLQRQLLIAEHLAKAFQQGDPTDPLSESGFAIVSIVLSYFEMISQFESGSSSDGNSKEYFIRGFRSVYPTAVLSDPDIKEIYAWARCGWYHSAMPKNETGLSRDATQAFEKERSYLVINPTKLVQDVQQHFLDYLAKLRNPAFAKERCNFQTYFRSLQPQGAGPLPTISTTPPPWKV